MSGYAVAVCSEVLVFTRLAFAVCKCCNCGWQWFSFMAWPGEGLRLRCRPARMTDICCTMLQHARQ
jgi:hypothetical protein